MGHLQSRAPPPKLLMVGLDAAGKTSILQAMKLGEVKVSCPTIGWNVEEVESNKVDILSFALGGADNLRKLYRCYYEGVNGIVFVIDSSDRSRMLDARSKLSSVLSEELMQAKPLLIFANKQDVPHAASSNDIIDAFRLNGVCTRRWHIQHSSAITGDGLSQGLDWILHQLENDATVLPAAPPLPIKLGSFVVEANSIDVWTGNHPPPICFRDRSMGWGDGAVASVPRGTLLQVVEVYDGRETLLGVCCRTDGPEQVWFEYLSSEIQPEAHVIVSLQCILHDSGRTVVLCYSLSGSDLGRFEIVDERKQTLAELASFLSQRMSVSAVQLQFVFEDGTRIPGFPGGVPLIDVLQASPSEAAGRG